MSFGQVFAAYLESNNETQLQAAAAVHVSNSVISKVTLGKRKPSKELMKSANEHYDDPFLALAAWSEASGEGSVPILNNTDLHRAATHLKTIEEFEEAIIAIKNTPIMKRSDQLTPEDRKKIEEAIFECVEAVTAAIHHIAVLCKEYGFSWIGIWKEHRRQLKANQYIR